VPTPRRVWWARTLAGLFFAGCVLSADALEAQTDVVYDVAILGGRVIDPETGFDGVANVGVLDDRIAVVTAEPLTGTQILDATGLVVAPGFIDPLTSVEAARLPSALYKVTDGVTTVLGLHGGPVDVDGMYRAMESEEMLLNYGTNVGHGALRGAVGLSSGDEEERAVVATSEQIDQIVELAARASWEARSASALDSSTCRARASRRCSGSSNSVPGTASPYTSTSGTSGRSDRSTVSRRFRRSSRLPPPPGRRPTSRM
jgi:N-acyl-D-aspartate/D-glutamate deacylase